MQKVLSYLFLMCIAVGLSIAVMIYGWGLQPKSWWWIIGVGVFANTALRTISDKLGKEKG